ncbi:MAG TPA: plastocyanin/azurin family copper-binding protein [Solirubrobacterales bacterium]|nr:plastocyanin/azurin family copper-binding protein [Solirubrobacterales bacterium]
MKKKLSIALAITAIAPFGLVACGGDDEESSDDSATTTEEATTDSSSGGGSTLTFTAAEDGSLAFEEQSAETEAGSVTVELDNPSSTPHDVRIEGPDGDVGGTEQVTGDTTSASVELESGDYTFYCSVSGHREAGMEGDLTVE